MSTAVSLSNLSHRQQRAAAAAAARVENTRGLAALLLAVVVAALAVVADQLVDTWADGELFLAWTLLWAVVFVGSLLLTGTIRRVGLRTMASLDQWARTQAAARADARLRSLAQRDPRLMAELVAIEQRAAVETPVAPAAAAKKTSAFAQRSAQAAKALDSHLFYL